MARTNLLDIAKTNGRDREVGLIEEVAIAAPEVMALPARTIRGTTYKISSRITNPGVGFRDANAGWEPGKSAYFSRLVQCRIFGAVIQVDKAVARADEDGQEAVMARDAAGVAEQAIIELGQQTIYGTATDAKGFPGLEELFKALATERTALGLASLEVDAAGASANTGSSVYMIHAGINGIQYIFGQGDGFQMGDWTEQQITDADGKVMPAFVNEFQAWVGLQVASIHSIGRIRDLTAETDKKLTDAMLWSLWHKFPVAKKPNMILMSRRSSEQLQTSRTVVLNAQGNTKAGKNIEVIPEPADLWNNIPIIVTDSITDTEALDD